MGLGSSLVPQVQVHCWQAFHPRGWWGGDGGVPSVLTWEPEEAVGVGSVAKAECPDEGGAAPAFRGPGHLHFEQAPAPQVALVGNQAGMGATVTDSFCPATRGATSISWEMHPFLS